MSLQQYRGCVFCVAWSVPRIYKGNGLKEYKRNPCEGGVEYLHRDPASRKRRRKGKSQIWESKIWSRVPRGSDPRKTARARTSSIRTKDRPVLSSERASHKKQDRNSQTVINIWLCAPDGARRQDLLTDWPTVSRNVTLTLSTTELSVGDSHGKLVVEQVSLWRLCD
jgi:hypothetical protein